MGEPAASASTVPAGSDNPPEKRTCRDCGETKVVSPETWPYRSRTRGAPYQAAGQRCKLCEAARKAAYEERRDKIAALVADVPAEKIRKPGDAKSQQKEAVNQSRLDVAKALKAGSKVLNESAPGILARILGWAEDEQDENHRWAVQFLAERIVPRKLYEELGGQAAGVGSLQDKRPQFLVQIVAAQPEQGRIIDGGRAETVELLPAPQQS